MTCAASQCWKSIVLWRHVLSYRVHWTIFQVRRRISTFFVDYNCLIHVNGTDLCILKLKPRHNFCKKVCNVLCFICIWYPVVFCIIFFCNKPLVGQWLSNTHIHERLNSQCNRLYKPLFISGVTLPMFTKCSKHPGLKMCFHGYENVKGTVHPKIYFFIIYSPSSCSTLVWITPFLLKTKEDTLKNVVNH